MPIRSIIQSTFFDKEAAQADQPPLVTVTGEFGAGVEAVSRELAKQLDVKYFDYWVLDSIIREARLNFELRKKMESRHPNNLASWIQSFFQKGDGVNEEYLALLVKTVLGIAPAGGVIVGRGAHLILSDHKVLRLKVEAGPEFCAKQVADRKGISLKAARKMVAKINKERMKFVADIYEKYPGYSSYYDLVLSSEVMSTQQIVDVALSAMGVIQQRAA
ncbi:MAG: cytidylate kinase-like family protein [Magnetococcales bacterium]|nr:cytidylate kinase-like family protein [Magnetococcales bacterium]